ncbi:MAG: enoyl-CoA hydratase [Gammaproteobacteria bacterium]|nr:enoyl-CoA hydratase [Gammaproteobacteria bacterium]
MHELRIEDGLAVLAFDDGKANAVGYDFIDQMENCLDRAEREARAVVIAGRPGLFSGGFDLGELRKGPDAANALVDRGARMLLRLYAHPQPVVAACTGHAVAAGAFILLSCDTRIGGLGEFSIGLNETALGMSFPVFAIELTHARLSKRHVTAAFVQSALYGPEEAVDAGFLDEAVAVDAAVDRACAEARRLGELPDVYGANKRLIRANVIQTIEASLADG